MDIRVFDSVGNSRDYTVQQMPRVGDYLITYDLGLGQYKIVKAVAHPIDGRHPCIVVEDAPRNPFAELGIE